VVGSTLRTGPHGPDLPDPTQLPRPWLERYPPGVPATYDYPPVPLTRFLDDAARDFPDVDATVFGRARMTYTELLEAVDRCATAIGRLGVARGTRVGMALPNLPAAPIALFAVLRLGAVAVPVPPATPEAELARRLRTTGCEVLVAAATSLPAVRAVRGRLPRLRHVITTGVEDWFAFPRDRLVRVTGRRDGTYRRVTAADDAVRLVTLLEQADAVARQAPVTPATLAAIVLAARGEGGGALLTHANLLAAAFQARLWIPDVQAGRERVLVAEPIHDLVGNTIGLLSSVLAGATTILMDHDASLGRTIERTSPTLLIVRAPRVDRLLLEDDAGRRDLTSLRVCLLVGGGLHRHKAKEFERRAAGARVRHLHGWKATVPISHGQPVYGRTQPTRYGLPVTSTVAAVVDPEDPTTERQADQTGRLIVHGPQVPGGGWVATDLIATVDADGWFTVIGRDDEVVDVAGKVRSPARIVDELLAHPHVRDAEVVEVDGELVAAVAPARRKRPDPLALREALAFHLDTRALPDDIVVVDDLPRSLRSTRDTRAAEDGWAELRDQIRAAREAGSMHTGPDSGTDPEPPTGTDPDR
jgi:long-chain acyl-CoA synthetase